MVRSLILLLTITFVSVLAFENNELDTDRSLKNDKELSSLRRKFDLFFDPDEGRGESRAALRYILTFLNKRPGAIQPSVPATNDICGDKDDTAASKWNTNAGNGFMTKSLLPAMIASMKENALFNIV